MKYMTRFLAFVCEVCPLCILGRRFPVSRFAKVLKKTERFCPFCRAHRRLEQEGQARRRS